MRHDFKPIKLSIGTTSNITRQQQVGVSIEYIKYLDPLNVDVHNNPLNVDIFTSFRQLSFW
jgi:hypothetical protein